MVAAVFPGQGSQKPGMGRELFESEPHAAEVFARAGDALGFDVAALCFETDEDTLRQTENAQVALFTCGEAAFGIAAGHSVGEYAALAAAGFLTVEDGARLVRRRGLLMAASGQARPGAMAAVLGLEREALEGVCQAASDVGVVVIANDNCPGQLVISGSVEGVARAGELASEAGAKRVLSLNVSGAFHSPLMTEAAAEMGAALREVEFRPGRMPVVANATAESPRTSDGGTGPLDRVGSDDAHPRGEHVRRVWSGRRAVRAPQTDRPRSRWPSRGRHREPGLDPRSARFPINSGGERRTVRMVRWTQG